jgi:aryl-alcohol dehydrogenase-like predicted oxidoreductase
VGRARQRRGIHRRTGVIADARNTDHDDGIRIIDRALDAGINFVDTADIYSQGESEVIVGTALAGGRRDDIVLATKAWGPMAMTPTSAASRAAGSSGRSRARCGARTPTGSTCTRSPATNPTSTSRRPSARSRTSSVRGKVRYIGSSVFPPSAIVEAQWAARERGLQRYVCEQPPYSMPARGIEADVLPTCLRHGMGVIPWSPVSGRWLSGKWRVNADDLEPMSDARRRLADSYDLSLPSVQRKLEAAEALAQLAEQAGMSLIEMAIAFVINHPAVTAAIIGPRTMEQFESRVPAADVTLSDDLLDQIDEIVTPGTNVNPADDGWVSPALQPAARRRLSARRSG